MIQARYQIPVTSPGAILREERKLGTSLGIDAEKVTSQGQLVSDEIVNAVVKTWLARHASAFVFDGYPRSLGQASALDSMLSELGSQLDVALLLEVDYETIRERVERRLMCSSCGRIVSVGLHVPSASAPCPSCGGKLTKRLDDSPETLALRMQEYADKTEPLIGYYRQRGLLCEVNAARTPQMVFADIEKILETP
jgi:adenylate kinase